MGDVAEDSPSDSTVDRTAVAAWVAILSAIGFLAILLSLHVVEAVLVLAYRTSRIA